MPSSLAFSSYGDGPIRVLVLHDWFCDRSSWDAAITYLTPERFTYVFADLRGYGGSRGIAGSYSLDEAAGDTIALADRLGWDRFSLIGHSMSGLVVQRVMQLVPQRIARVVAVTPAPPAGANLEPKALEFFQSIALGGDEERLSKVGAMWGSRLSDTWTRFKLRRWRETADPAAAAKYVEMWGCTDISAAARGVETPILIVAAEQDAPMFRAEALETSVLPYYPNATLTSLSDSGHYPMQEQPPLLAAVIERFLAAS